MKRNVLNSPRLLELKQRRRRAILNKILISFLGLSIIFVGLGYLSRLKNLNIQEVQIVGNKVLDTELLRTAVQEAIAGKYLWLFPKTNILYYPQNALKNGLQNKFKRIKDITLSIQDNKILEVSLNERTAKYTWCGNDLSADIDSTPTNENAQKCYFMDETGYLFDEAPYFSGEVYFKFYGLADNPSPNEMLGAYFSKQNFSQMISFKDVLTDIALKPVALYITPEKDIQIFLSRGASVSLDTSPKILLKADADFQNVAENLKTALNTEPLKSEIKNKYASLLYIDLRFKNKVFYKFQ